MPWPLVQPLLILVPMPVKRPAKIKTGIDEIKSSVEKVQPKKFTDEMRDSINESVKDGKKKVDKS